MLEGKSSPAKLRHHIFEGQTSVVEEEAHYELVKKLSRRMLGLPQDDATKSGLRNHGYLQDRSLHSSC